MSIVKTPSKFHSAFNPIIFSGVKIDGANYEELVITTQGSDITLRREYINNQVEFNISDIISAYFADKLSDSISTQSTDVFVEPKLFVEYTVNNSKYYAINAVHQIMEGLNFYTKIGKPLTTLSKLKVYDNYPFDISILCDKPITTNKGTLIENSVNRIKISTGELTIIQGDVLTIPGNNIYTMAGNKLVINSGSLASIINECTPSNPFYIRWINSIGGIDYFMFSYNQIYQVSLKENKTFQKYINDYLSDNATDTSYFKSAIQLVTVGVDGLEENDYNALTKMTLSNYIEFYNISLGKWIRLIVNKSDNTRETINALCSFECSFLMPELNLQF